MVKGRRGRRINAPARIHRHLRVNHNIRTRKEYQGFKEHCMAKWRRKMNAKLDPRRRSYLRMTNNKAVEKYFHPAHPIIDTWSFTVEHYVFEPNAVFDVIDPAKTVVKRCKDLRAVAKYIRPLVRMKFSTELTENIFVSPVKNTHVALLERLRGCVRHMKRGQKITLHASGVAAGIEYLSITRI